MGAVEYRVQVYSKVSVEPFHPHREPVISNWCFIRANLLCKNCQDEHGPVDRNKTAKFANSKFRRSEWRTLENLSPTLEVSGYRMLG